MSEKKLMSLDDMFGDSINTTEQENQTKIEISRLMPFENHPFKLYEGERFENMVRSIKEFGVIVPVIVRPKGYDYEILSGHNRVNAAKAAGLLEVPVVIKENLEYEEAMLIVTETNLMQRSFSDMLHSERAAALSEHHKALSSQGKRTDLLKEIESLLNADEIKGEETSSPVGKKLRTHDQISEAYNLSKNSIARYLRISRLADELKEFIDSEEISIRAGVDLSYLLDEEQILIADILTSNEFKIDMKKAETLRAFSEGKKLNEEIAYSILSGELNKKPKANKPAPIKLKPRLISKFFAPEIKQPEIEEVIEKALELYFETQKKEVLDE